MKFHVIVIFSLILHTSSFAQITIEFPYSRLVFQQDSLGRGEILLSGYSLAKADTIQARLIPFAATTGKATEWVTCRTTDASSQQNFSVVVQAAAGWYNLEVRAIKNATAVAEASLPRIGIGEVFVIAGQSNAQGQTLKEARSSKDPYERVGAFSGYDEKMNAPSFKAEQLNNYISIYPVGVTSWCWAELGDKLTERLNVPVFFLNAAWGGTGSQDWVNSVDSSATFEKGRGYIPYAYLQKTIQFYRNILGLRAVLWHQGESDAYRNNFRAAGTPPIDYFKNMLQIIEPSRKQVGGDLAWVISQTSLIYGITDSLVIEAQRRLPIEIPNVFLGPYTDTLTNARYDGVHFTNEFDKRGLSKLASAWDQALDSTFFKRSVPTLPNFEKKLFVLDSNKVLIPQGFGVKRLSDKATTSFRFLADETGNFYAAPLLPCGKRFRQLRELPQQASFNDITGERPVNKLVILTNRAKDYNTSANYRRSSITAESSGGDTDPEITFTAEIGGCYND